MNKKTILLVLGVVLVLVGLLGFVSDPVLGIFEVDTMHNLVHLLTGAAALYVATQKEAAIEMYGKIFAVVYGLVTVLGFISGDGTVLGLLEINGADNLLHLLLTAAFAYLGFVDVKKKHAAA